VTRVAEYRSGMAVVDCDTARGGLYGPRWCYPARPAIRSGGPARSGVLVACAAVCLAGAVVGSVAAAPRAAAMPYGNFTLNIDGRNDFHTWIWMISPCGGECLLVLAHPQPVAKAYPYTGRAEFADGRYTLTVDDPFGLRCDNIYYGPTIATHDVYAWDAVTLAGSVQSTFDAGCDGAPAGVLEYPFTLSRL
jgi:hypothetical protein